jgi:S-ribosylhomocysteine lyase
MAKHIVKSFNLDHTKVVAPFVRLADKITSPKGDIITKLDIRFCQPNKESIDSASLHTLEHLLATYLREGQKYNVIDLSPMGCQTGFYFIVFDEVDIPEFIEYLKDTLRKIENTESVVGATEVECGNYKLHDLAGAKRYARELLNKKIGEL